MNTKYDFDLSIIIVNWNAKDLLRTCLNSIYEKTREITFEIIVVDNASSDDSVEVVRAEFPQVKLLTCAENLGFGRANNLALGPTRGKYIGLLNPDTVLMNDAFSILFSKLESKPEIGVVGPQLLASDYTVQRACARRFITPNSQFVRMLGLCDKGFAPSLSHYLPQAEYDISQSVDCLSGACMVIRRDILSDGYIFDPRYFMYGEDVDLCYETIQRGWQVFYQSEANVIHYGGKSGGQDSIATLYKLKANYQFFAKRYGKLSSYIYLWGYIIISALKLAVTWLVGLNPRIRQHPLWVKRRLSNLQMVQYALYFTRASKEQAE